MSDARLKTLKKLVADLPQIERDVLATVAVVLSDRAWAARVDPDHAATQAIMIAELLVEFAKPIREGVPASGEETIGDLLGLAGTLAAMAAAIAARDEAEGRA